MAISKIESAGLDAAVVAPLATALSTVVGSAPSYACRAWVNFNGTGTVAIRASGNVSSITDSGVGTYLVNYATALEANMAPVVTVTDDGVSNRAVNVQSINNNANLTSYCVVTIWQAGGGGVDSTGVYFAVFR